MRGRLALGSLVILIIGFCAISTVRGDLPVHCKKEQIVGKWQFSLSDVAANNDDFNPCWHSQPDKQSSSYHAGQNEFVGSTTVEFFLNADDSVESKTEGKGGWTMVYDEGFDIRFNKRTFFVFSKYTHEDGQYKSYCSETLVGWFNNIDTHQKGCVKGKRLDGNNEASDSLDMVSVVQPKDTQTDDDNDDDANVSSEQNDSLTDAIQKAKVSDSDMNDSNSESHSHQKKKSSKQNADVDYYNFDEADLWGSSSDNDEYDLENDDFSSSFAATRSSTWEGSFEELNYAPLSLVQTSSSNTQQNKKSFRALEETEFKENIQLHHDFKDHEKVVERLNKIQKDWVATVPESFAEFDIKTMNRYAGRRQYGHRAQQGEPKYPGFSASSFVQTESSDSDSKKWEHYSREDLGDLPKEFSAADLINDPIQQKDCGSCYAIATMEMLSARLQKQGENVFLSVQHSLDCNYYNQGCDGGYGYLVNKFFTENDLVPESCSPYKGEDGVCSTCDAKKQSKTYRVKDFNFIGGAYGKTTEQKMMEELMKNGPIVVSFEPAYDFMYYSSGIYHSVDAEDWILKGERKPDWEKVDHSVLCYGWGQTDDGKKFWRLLNSWGKGWGENGHFRMRRGTDESHIESMGEYATVQVNHKGNSFVQTEEKEPEQERTFLGLSEQQSFKNNKN